MQLVDLTPRHVAEEEDEESGARLASGPCETGRHSALSGGGSTVESVGSSRHSGSWRFSGTPRNACSRRSYDFSAVQLPQRSLSQELLAEPSSPSSIVVSSSGAGAGFFDDPTPSVRDGKPRFGSGAAAAVTPPADLQSQGASLAAASSPRGASSPVVSLASMISGKAPGGARWLPKPSPPATDGTPEEAQKPPSSDDASSNGKVEQKAEAPASAAPEARSKADGAGCVSTEAPPRSLTAKLSVEVPPQAAPPQPQSAHAPAGASAAPAPAPQEAKLDHQQQQPPPPPPSLIHTLQAQQTPLPPPPTAAPQPPPPPAAPQPQPQPQNQRRTSVPSAVPSRDSTSTGSKASVLPVDGFQRRLRALAVRFSCDVFPAASLGLSFPLRLSGA